MTDDAGGVSAHERPVRPLLLTEKELLDIVDKLIRDRAYNRPAAVAIAMAVGAAVEAEVRERCAKMCEEVESQAWALWKTTADPIEQGRNIGAQHCADAIRA